MTELQRNINNALQKNPKTKDLPIEALDNNGIITLKGFAPSRQKSMLAANFTKQLDGVAAVINEIRVDHSADKIGL